jgi:uncharacterized repeat protein (TIGR03803 family)
MTTNGLLTTLVSLNGRNGSYPLTKLLEVADGSFVGSTPGGGVYNAGTIFQMWPNGIFRTVYSFNGTNDGGRPHAAVIQGNDGHLYGMTSDGGAHNWGTIYRLTVDLLPVFQSVAQVEGVLELTWSTVAGRSYQLQYKTNLAQSGWSNLGEVSTATNTTLRASDLCGPDGQRFYRVVTE